MGGKGTVISQTSGQDGKLRIVVKPADSTYDVGVIVNFKLIDDNQKQDVGHLYDVTLDKQGNYVVSGTGTRAIVDLDDSGLVAKFSGTTTLGSYPPLRLYVLKVDKGGYKVDNTPVYEPDSGNTITTQAYCAIIYDANEDAIGVDHLVIKV